MIAFSDQLQTKTHTAEAFSYLLETIIVIIERLKTLGDDKRIEVYLEGLEKELKEEFARNMPDIALFSLAARYRRAPSPQILDDLLKHYPQLLIKGVGLELVTLSSPGDLTRSLIKVMSEDLCRHRRYYINQYLVLKQPTFLLREIFIAKGEHQGRRISERSARSRAWSVWRSLRRKQMTFGQAVKRFSDSPNTKTKQIMDYGVGYDKLAGLKVGEIPPPIKRARGYYIYKLTGKHIEKPRVGSADYDRYLGAALLTRYNEKTARVILRSGSKESEVLKGLRSNYRVTRRSASAEPNPILADNVISGLPPIDLTWDRGYKKVFEVYPRIIYGKDPKIQYLGPKTARQLLARFLAKADDQELIKLWQWLVKFKFIGKKDRFGLAGLPAEPEPMLKMYYRVQRGIMQRAGQLSSPAEQQSFVAYYACFLDLYFHWAYFSLNQQIAKAKISWSLGKGARGFRRLLRRCYKDVLKLAKNEPKRSSKLMMRGRKVLTFATHEQAYFAIKAVSGRNLRVIHFDTHKDLWELSNLGIKGRRGKSQWGKWLNQANYLTALLREGAIKDLTLVYPGESRSGTDKPSVSKEHFIWDQFHYFPDLLKMKKSYVLYAEGQRITATDLNSLPNSNKEVVLDIDLDFFVCNPVKGQQPWISIEKFIKVLKEQDYRIKLITFSYSIQDGYVSRRFRRFGARLVDKLRSMLP